MRGRLIVVEGLDGTGKTTLSKGLAASLGAVWLTTPSAALRPFREPFDAHYARHPGAAQLFYAASVVAAGEEADALRAAGRDVVIDRYWATTRAYGLVRGSPYDLAEVEAHLPAADLTLLVELDEGVRRGRLLARGASALDQETLDPRRAKALRLALREQLRGRVAGHPLLVDVTNLDEAAAVARARALVDRVHPVVLFPGVDLRAVASA